MTFFLVILIYNEVYDKSLIHLFAIGGGQSPKPDSTQEQNSAPHPAVGAERLADVRNNSAKFGFSSSFSITSTLCVKNGISSKQFGIHFKRFDKVPPTFEPM